MPAVQTGVRAVAGARLSRSMDALMSVAIRPLVSRAKMRLPAFPNGRRYVVVHLDGVSRGALVSAIRRGYAPFLGRLIASGGYAFSPAYSGAPASTPAFQAGLLYGQRHSDIPGFAWFDRAAGREVRMDRAQDARATEAALQARSEGLMRHGSASFSVFTGEARMNAYCRSGWGADEVRLVEHGDLWNLAAAAVTGSVLVSRLVGRVFQETAGALLDFFRQLGRVGRLRHEPTFLMRRMGLSLAANEAATWNAVLDIGRGTPALYVCFGDYDEIAHRRGPDSRVSMLALWGMDRAIARIFAAAAAVPEMGYDFFLVADHGQVATRPFEETAGLSLVDYLAAAQLNGSAPPRVPEQVARCMARFRAVDRAAQALPGKSLKERARGVAFDAARAFAHGRDDGAALERLGDIVVVEGGDIAHIYLGRGKRPLGLAEIEARYPRVRDLLVHCPGAGLVTARAGEAGAAWYRGRRLDLGDPTDARQIDIGYGGARAARYLSTLTRMPSAGDLIVYGNGLAQGDIAYAWEFGSHAGIAPEEVETFVIHPARLGSELSRVEHGADLHDFLVATYGRQPGSRAG